MVKNNFSDQKILKLGGQNGSILIFFSRNMKSLVISISPLCRLRKSRAVLREENRGPGGVNNSHIRKNAVGFRTVRYVIVTLELVQNASYFFLKMHTARVTKLDPTLYFTLLTACKLVVQT